MNLYDEYDIIEAQRMRADFTYRSFLSRDTTELDNFNKKIRVRLMREARVDSIGTYKRQANALELINQTMQG